MTTPRWTAPQPVTVVCPVAGRGCWYGAATDSGQAQQLTDRHTRQHAAGADLADLIAAAQTGDPEQLGPLVAAHPELRQIVADWAARRLAQQGT